MSNNPYSVPEGMEILSSRADALVRVRLPATLLLITGIISLLGGLFYALTPSYLTGFLAIILTQATEDPNFPLEQKQTLELQIQTIQDMRLIYYVQAGLGVLGAMAMCLGAVKMKKLESYGLAMAACIAAMCPFTSSCCFCIFPLAVGIWSLVVIINPDVKAHFS